MAVTRTPPADDPGTVLYDGSPPKKNRPEIVARRAAPGRRACVPERPIAEAPEKGSPVGVPVPEKARPLSEAAGRVPVLRGRLQGRPGGAAWQARETCPPSGYVLEAPTELSADQVDRKV